MKSTTLVTLFFFLLLPTVGQSRELFSKPTSWGTVIVEQQGNDRLLLFRSESGETEESRMSVLEPHIPRLPYVRQMMALTAVWEAQQKSMPAKPRFLVVGLGGASLSNALATVFPQAEVVSIEIEPVVVEAARKYFFYRESERVRTEVMDARNYLQENQQKFDLIFLDAFDGTGVPPTLRTLEFAQLLDRNLNPTGAVLANIHFTPREPSLRYQKSLKEVFLDSLLTLGVAQGVGLYTHSPMSTSVLSQKNQDQSWDRRYGLPLSDLLEGRHEEDLEQVNPFRDSES